MKLVDLLQVDSIRLYTSCVTLGFIWAVTNYYLRKSERKRLPYPPGPPGFPIIGNFFDTPRTHAWLQAADWGKNYGDVVFTESLGLKRLYLNSYAAANELLENRSGNYSSRPPFVLLTKVAGWEWATSLFPTGEPFRKFRHVMARHFQSSVLHKYYPLQSRLVVDMLHSILHSAEDYEKHIRRLPAAQVMMIAYGHEMATNGDEFVGLADDAMRNISKFLDDSYFDVLPILRFLPGWLPGMSRAREAKEGYKTGQAACYTPYKVAKEKFLNGTAVPSFTTDLLQLGENRIDLDEQLIAGTAGTLYVGASDTVTSVVTTAVLAMVLYPDVMRCAQEELDRVIGKDILPTFADRENLPYIEAICLECLRWEMVVPLGIPHYTEQDDVYNGYFIPAGTIVYPNQWAMGMDARVYESPEEFIPERWLQTDPPLSSNKYAFGFGRRICAGKDFAETTAYIAIASLLACFNFEKDLNEKGQLIDPDRDQASLPGAVRRAVATKCRITPRSDGIERLIRDSVSAFE